MLSPGAAPRRCADRLAPGRHGRRGRGGRQRQSPGPRRAAPGGDRHPYRAGSQLLTMGPGGEERAQVGEGPLQAQPEWSPDGTTIAYWGEAGENPATFLVGADGTHNRVLPYTKLPGPPRTFVQEIAVFDPTGENVVATAFKLVSGHFERPLGRYNPKGRPVVEVALWAIPTDGSKAHPLEAFQQKREIFARLLRRRRDPGGRPVRQGWDPDRHDRPRRRPGPHLGREGERDRRTGLLSRRHGGRLPQGPDALRQEARRNAGRLQCADGGAGRGRGATQGARGRRRGDRPGLGSLRLAPQLRRARQGRTVRGAAAPRRQRADGGQRRRHLPDPDLRGQARHGPGRILAAREGRGVEPLSC